jgi:preprotein translocase subunit YajC
LVRWLESTNDVTSLAMMAPPAGGPQPSLWLQVVPFVFIFAVIYLLLIRPARTRQKQVQQMLDALKTGDRVVTTGGLVGTLVKVERDLVQMRIADNVKVEVTRSAIAALRDSGADKAEG